MGSAVGRVLLAAGFRVVTALDGRSRASRALAEAAGLEDLHSLESVLATCDVFLSILPPAAAHAFAVEAGAISNDLQRSIIYADCNAVAPATAQKIADIFTGGPATFADVGIVGPAPRAGAAHPTRFYASGPARHELERLALPEMRWIDMGEPVGRASAIKMCYAAMNKGVDALYANILLASLRLGVDAELRSEFEQSQPEAAARMARRIPFMAATAERYSDEMGEIAATLEAAGLSGDFHRGAKWIYALLARSALATETRATLPDERSLDEALDAFVAALGN
jgi:3-hydroxyisobutyrate dehydrogenase-like beta-hydroxyacid dehydrogenase